jgi:hypothetical protein
LGQVSERRVILVNSLARYFNVGHTSASDRPVSSERVSGTQCSSNRPYCSVVFDVRNGLLNYPVYDLRDWDVFLERDSKRLEIALWKA